MAAAEPYGGVDDVTDLLMRADVFQHTYPFVPPQIVGPPPRRHARQHHLWRVDQRDGIQHAVRLSHPVAGYLPDLPIDLLTARTAVNDYIVSTAGQFAADMQTRWGRDDRPLSAESLRRAFAANPFFGSSAQVGLTEMRDGTVDVTAHTHYVNWQGGARTTYVAVCVRALNRSLNRMMVGYVGEVDKVNERRWAGLANPVEARHAWPSLSRREFWSEAAWRRAKTLVGRGGLWTRGWLEQRPRVRDAAIDLQR